MPTSSIDELLMGGKSATHPATPEDVYSEDSQVDDPTINNESDDTDYGDDSTEGSHETPILQEDSDEKEERRSPEKQTDDYGNESEPENHAIRERLERQARKHQAEIDDLRAQLASSGASREVQNAARDFEYNPNSDGDWQQQLAHFVKQTVSSMGREESEARSRQQEQQLQYEFESKFKAGLEKFHDFADVVSALPFEISNPMTLATRAMSDPAAFLYAAAKRQPAELERISKIRDPYAQMTEMGKLEERMRRNKPTTSAPRPLGRSIEDSTSPAAKKKSDPSIEDLIARADAKKLAKRKVVPRSARR